MLKNSYDLQFGNEASTPEILDNVESSSLGDTNSPAANTKHSPEGIMNNGGLDLLMNKLFMRLSDVGQGMSWDNFIHFCSLTGISDGSTMGKVDEEITISELERIYLTSRKLTDTEESVLYYDDFRMVALPKILQKKKTSMGSFLKDINKRLENVEPNI